MNDDTALEDAALEDAGRAAAAVPGHRLWHWTNAVALLALLMSGLAIFNAHPRLYWGEYGSYGDPAWLEIGATRSGEGAMRVGPVLLRTTGVLGVHTDAQGITRQRAFPGWATIPSYYSLSDARLWHLAFAWVLAAGLALYLGWAAGSGHLRHALHVRRAEWAPARLWRDVRDHARLRFRADGGQSRYNPLQKIAYAVVLFALLPVMIATGLAMAPAMDAAWPWLTEIWGGRQSARSVHFIGAAGLVGFTLLHLAMVLLAGPVQGLRAMIWPGRSA